MTAEKALELFNDVRKDISKYVEKFNKKEITEETFINLCKPALEIAKVTSKYFENGHNIYCDLLKLYESTLERNKPKTTGSITRNGARGGRFY